MHIMLIYRRQKAQVFFNLLLIPMVLKVYVYDIHLKYALNCSFSTTFLPPNASLIVIIELDKLTHK